MSKTKRVSKSKKVDNSTPHYIEADYEDKAIFRLKEAFTFGINGRENNPVFPYVISLSLRNNPNVMTILRDLKKKYKVTEKLFYGEKEDLIYISLMDISKTQRETLYKQRCFVNAKVIFDQLTYKGDNVYMNLRLMSVKKVKYIPKQVAEDNYSSSSDSE